MDILNKLDKIKDKFDKLQNQLEEENKEFEEYKQEKSRKVDEIIDELKRLQGERRLLVEMGEEEGILEVDEKGYITPIEE